MTATPSGDSALLLLDVQNDFVHPDGAYSRGGVSSAETAVIPTRLAPLVAALRADGIPIIATLFTLVPAPAGPLIPNHLASLRPFLGNGDFAPGSWGQSLVDELTPADVTVEKVAYCAFHASRLQFVLDAMGITHLLVAGIVTNGGVATTVRSAHVRGYQTTVLADGCAAFTPAAHEAALESMRTITSVATMADLAGPVR